MRNIRTRVSSPGAIKLNGVGPRQVRAIASDATQDRMGDILEPSGVRLAEYRRNPVVLWQHDASQPIARCAHIGIENNQVIALIEFPPEGVSERSDECLRLTKAGIVGAVSVGFIPNSWEPIRDAGYRFTDWTMLELSCVSVPANPSALITERSMRRRSDDADGTDDADDGTATLGNCGRPIGSECGMKDVARCSIHGFSGSGVGTGEGDERAARLRYARTLQRKLDGTIIRSDAPTALLRHAAAIRARHGLPKRHDPRVIAAAAQFRMRNF